MPCPKRKAAAPPSHKGWIQPDRIKIITAVPNVTAPPAASPRRPQSPTERGLVQHICCSYANKNTPLSLQDLPLPRVVLSLDARVSYSTEVRVGLSRQVSLGKKPIQRLSTKEKLNKPALLCPNNFKAQPRYASVKPSKF